MDKYRKNSSKILPKIENEHNRVVLYSEYDTFYDIDDNIYILVFDQTTSEYTYLDSVNNEKKYKILNKKGNRITLDIVYDTFIKNLGKTELETNCYISRIILNNTEVKSGTINSSLITDITMQPNSVNKIIWKQGIILNSTNEILNINFEPKYDDEYLVLKTEYDGTNIRNYFTKNNKNNGLNYINIENNDYLNLTNCNLSIGYYNKCIINTENYKEKTISNSNLDNCSINGTIVINSGYFLDCLLLSHDIVWNYGIWENNLGFEFKPNMWYDGIWKKGELSNITHWKNGIFDGGTFNGNLWDDGTFNGGVFSGTEWVNGTFNDGTFSNSTWNNGIFNGGTFSNSIWNDGIFNGGTFSGSDWVNGVFSNGIIKDSNWIDGKMHNGKIKSSSWTNGVVYYGIFNDVDWEDGEFYNGIMNNSRINKIMWYNGITNNSIFGIDLYSEINWKNGSFNSGVFGYPYDILTGEPSNSNWIGGTFYSGDFYGKYWFDGIMYTGNDNYGVIDDKFKLDKVFEPYKA